MIPESILVFETQPSYWTFFALCICCAGL